MMEMINGFVDLLDKNLVIGFLSISLTVNVVVIPFLFRLYLKTNDKYIDVLRDNVNITGKINAVMGRLKINSGITEPFVLKEPPK
jgi:hypothetical protein